MLKLIGKSDENDWYLATGTDRIRGIIGREEILDHAIIVFENCPQIHSFFVRNPFRFFVVDPDRRELIFDGILLSNRVSGFFSFKTIFFESRVNINTQEIVKWRYYI